MRISDWSSDVCSSDLAEVPVAMLSTGQRKRAAMVRVIASGAPIWLLDEPANGMDDAAQARLVAAIARHRANGGAVMLRSEEHTSELQSLMRTSYAGFCLQKNNPEKKDKSINE